MYFSSLKLFEVLKFFQFLMLFENQFLDTSSNFGAPFVCDRILKRKVENMKQERVFPRFVVTKKQEKNIGGM